MGSKTKKAVEIAAVAVGVALVGVGTYGIIKDFKKVVPVALPADEDDKYTDEIEDKDID